MNTSTSSNDEFPRIENQPGPSTFPERDSRVSYEASEPEVELGLWLQAVRSFFDARNHPFPDAEQSAALTRDWANELVIARQTLLRISQLTLRMVHLEGSRRSVVALTVESPEDADGFNDPAHADVPGPALLPLVDLAEAIGDVASVCETLLDAPRVGLHAWATVGKVLSRELDRSDIVRSIERVSCHDVSELTGVFTEQAKKVCMANDYGVDVKVIVSKLVRLLKRLRLIDSCLQRDQPLKQTLPVFCLIYKESRALLDFIESRVLTVENLDRRVFDALDGLNYAIAMELRKVFARELVGLASLRHAPSIYARVENAHGLLRDCFQQSIVGVAQLFDEGIDATRLFDTFQTRLEQSLVLRKDIWTLLQLVRRAEEERERYPISRLLERLTTFREGSLRYLMYKDWEACERFMEEVAAARGVVEVTPVVHRFSAYLETLLGQVNMRSVLLDHEFDYNVTEEFTGASKTPTSSESISL